MKKRSLIRSTKPLDSSEQHDGYFKIQFHQVGPSEVLTNLAKTHCDRLRELLIDTSNWHIVLSKTALSKKTRVEVHSSWGLFQGTAMASSFQASMNSAMAKIERQILKTKSKLKNHKKKDLSAIKRTERELRFLKRLGRELRPDDLNSGRTQRVDNFKKAS